MTSSSPPLKEQPHFWEELWKRNFTPFDRGVASPALVELLEKFDFPPLRRILVPGCGRGYDLTVLANGIEGVEDAIGLDVSEIPLSEARKQNTTEKVSFVVGNFFLDSEPWCAEQFDLIYDYTFLCALQPSMRSSWAKRMSELIRPGGFLIALQHPLFEREGGPPFTLSPKLYESLLCDNFDRVYFEKPTMYHRNVGELDMISVYKRR